MKNNLKIVSTKFGNAVTGGVDLSKITKDLMYATGSGKRVWPSFQHTYKHLLIMDKIKFESEFGELIWALVALVSLACFCG